MPTDRARRVFAYSGANVRRSRDRLGLTQERLAEASELDLRSIQRVERGTMNPSAAILVALAHALGVAPGSLFRKADLPPARTSRPPSKKKRAPKL